MSKFRVGAVFPTTEIGTDSFVIRDFAQAVEGMGFSHIAAYDHVVGASRKNRPDWIGVYDDETPFHEPIALLSFLAGVTTRIGLVTAVIILPQRQTVLFAKQAANVDIYSRGRLRLGVGLGWNQVEYEALDVPFEHRGARMDDQVRFMRRLWSEPVITEAGPFHRITEAGINPFPVQRPIPIWIGGWSEAAMRRAVRLGDGWMPSLAADQAEPTMAAYHAALRAVGRDPATVGLENMVLLGATVGGPIRTADEGADDAEVWRKAGANGINVHTMAMGFETIDQHLAVLGRIAERLELAKGG